MAPNSSKKSGAKVQSCLSQICSEVKRNKNPHAILGLQPGCTEREVTTAYRQLALLLHPDKCTDEKQTELHTTLFVKIDEAKDALLDPIASNQEGREGEGSTRPTKSPWRNPMFNKKRDTRGDKGGRRESQGDGYYYWMPNRNAYSEDEPAAEATPRDDLYEHPSGPVPGSQSQEDEDAIAGAEREQAEEVQDEDNAKAETTEIQPRSNFWVSSSGKQKQNLDRSDIIHAPVFFANGREKFYSARHKKHQTWAMQQEKQEFGLANAAEDVFCEAWWEEDGPAMFAEEEVELGAEHEDVLEEEWIPISVPYNLGDSFPER
ncbi:hypothetical protein CERZMDRAFT_96953 [Cercospora zeae-maydis SCOH1-5]|uniref:J domain-containing protein n=1 Tax=Cercospora zeae-maydis SCOH1-5 TaxID=717836 RepID=A0A6A6FJ47_9PEZI|nr:hypothetical protein CERZMDRAFT_96953 [Cercospora zeae-maydis SCOH1-5]